MRQTAFKATLETVRKQTLQEALTAMARHYEPPTAFARHGYLLVTPEMEQMDFLLVDIDGTLVERRQLDCEVVFDRPLEALGIKVLRLRNVPAGSPSSVTKDWEEWAVVLRVALVFRILEESKLHLSRRISGGIKTIQHQLVKNAFAECVGALELLLSQLDSDEETDSRYVHEQLTEMAREPLKLMGGHGYLLTGTSKYGYASELIGNLS